VTTDTAVPELERLRKAVAAFGGGAAAPPVLDLALPGDRSRLLTRLNAWGCRIPYPQAGEPDPFDVAVAGWARQREKSLPRTSLAELTDADLEPLGDCFAELAAISVGRPGGRPRSLGPTAASKALHMLRPWALMPWDEAIAQRLHGGRGPAEYVAHQQLGRAWARGLIESTGWGEETLTTALGAQGRTLAKVLDDYCYLRFTRLEQL
jgi:hypothetical protein